jgi:FolB domain-containing protein
MGAAISSLFFERKTVDKIYIEDLQLRTVIGVHDWERNIRQDLTLNLTLEVDLKKAGHSDAITDTVDYRTLTKSVIAFVEMSSFYLIEKLAETVAQIVLKTDGVAAVTVRVDKPGALRYARSAGVEIRRSR